MEKTIEERENIHQYFMNIAYMVASRSTCIKRKVGAVIVQNKHIVSTGYNNPPVGLPNCNQSSCQLDNNGKCLLALHAECNAIFQAPPLNRNSAIMYVTCQPCDKCQLAILNSGITLVLYKERHTPKYDRFKNTHVKCYQIDEYIKEGIDDHWIRLAWL